MAEVKGIVVNAMRAFLDETNSRDVIERAVATLSKEDAALIDRRFLDSSSYPYGTMVALRRLMRALAAGRMTYAEDVGAYIATYVFTGPYKPFLAKSAEEMVQKIAVIKEYFYRETRSLEGQMTGPSSSTITYRYDSGVRPTRGVCQSNLGFWSRVLQLASGSQVVGTHAVCVCEGAERCEFAFSWQASTPRPPAARQGPGSSG